MMKSTILFLWACSMCMFLVSGCTSDENLLPDSPEEIKLESASGRLADHPITPFIAQTIMTSPPVLLQEIHANKMKLSTTMNFVVVSENQFLNNGIMEIHLEALWDEDMTGPVKGTFTIILPDDSFWSGHIQGKRHKTAESTWNWTGHYIGKGVGGVIEGMQILFTEEIESYEPAPMILTTTVEGKIISG